MNRSVYACLADEEIVVDDRDVIFGKLDVKLDILGAKIGRSNKRGQSILAKLMC